MFSDKKNYNTLKIADFGLSIYSENDKEDKICGTLIYKSPEQLTQPYYDHYVDYWAAGFILYILCSGGCHPIFRKGMNYEDYTDEFKKRSKEWKFPSDFPM